ncbi:hypothetical protein LDENG_00060020 [Lucifuga dentata]|nr:hypothetical protein LDENG_00060020 [Lucifuga dentata]
MEDGVKEEPAQPKEPKFLGKAGWVKKASSRLLASYKDRFIHVEKTEIAVYENEDLQTCLERFDLENYEKCLELRSTFKKKNRLILIRASKSGNKVHDVKFQAQTAEEKDAWIKALRDGINRAKNKIFDEVKVDESSNLDHVTRTRPKGNHNRRPPTRIHMKEVANVSSDGMLRLDLDLEDATMPNGTHYANADATDAPKELVKAPTPPSTMWEVVQEQSEEEEEEPPQTEPEAGPPKKVLKPPMPPSKEAKPMITPEDEPDQDEKKVLMPPRPPSKESKPCVSPVEESTKEDKTKQMSQKSPDVRKKTDPPPTPPSKPSSSSTSNLAESSKSEPRPPTPPSKDKKSSNPAVEPSQDALPCTVTLKESEEQEDDVQKENMGTPDPSGVRNGPVITDASESRSTEHAKLSEGEEETGDTNKTSNNEPQIPVQLTVEQNKVTPEPVRKSPSPLVHPKKKPVKFLQPEAVAPSEISIITNPQEELNPIVSLHTAPDALQDSLPAEERLKVPVESKSAVPAVVVTLNAANSLSLIPLLGRLHEGKKKKAEEKSVDSGQHSDDDSEGSEGGDTLAASTAALRGSHAALDMLDVNEDDFQISDSQRQAQVSSKVSSAAFKSSTKAKSASIGDLVSDSSGCIQRRHHARALALGDGVSLPRRDVMKLETEVALEMEQTSELLNLVSQSQAEGAGEPANLLATAMEKLKKADHFLREVKKLKDSKPIKDASKRNSW